MVIIQNNFKCPLLATEQRLSDCLSLLLETRNNYFTPNSFRLSLNNCIQTERNVTWVLQKAKPQFSNFDTWYGNWQEKMQEDTILKWLVNARNIVVKEGDLSTLSKLRVAVVETWYAPPYLEIEIPPLTDTEDYVKKLASKIPSNLNLKVGLLRVERLWIDEQLKECEILEALSHVVIFLLDLVLDAHKELLYKKDLLECPWYTDHDTHKRRYIDCIKPQDWDRTIWLDLNTGQKLSFVDIHVDRVDADKVKRHYALPQQHKAKRKPPENLKDEADFLFQTAKNILTVDGYHMPIAVVGYSTGHRAIVGLQMLNRAEKHLAIRKLASDIEKTGATSVVLINESWIADFTHYRLTPTGVESPTLREALQLVAANKKGETYTKKVFFTRDERGKVNLGKEFDLSPQVVNILAPIKEVWNKRRDDG